MRYVLGIAGGQTTTTCVAADETGCLLGVGLGGPSNNLHEPGGMARTQKSVGDAIANAVRAADLQNARIAAACLSLPVESEQAGGVFAPLIPAANLLTASPSRAALYSVTFGRPGVVVLAGTHASACGRDAQGNWAQCGGWGGLLGDAGSGYWIAGRALNACCRGEDGIDAPTSLLPLVLKHLEADNLKQVQRDLEQGRLYRPEIAGISEIVSRAAAQGDKAARRILREAGKELAVGALSALRRLDMLGTPQEPVVVGTVGSVFRAGRAILRPFRETILQSAPNALIVPARVSLAAGATLLALETLDIPLQGELLAKMEAGMPRPLAAKA